MNSRAGGDAPEASDAVEAILAEYIDRLNRGERLQPDLVLVAHPTLGPQLLEYLQAYQALGASTSGAANDQAALGTLGDYTLRRQIGRGGMGVVYEAWEGSMDRRVALKVLPAGVAADDRAVARFTREARLAGKLEHQNIVRVYSTGVREGTPWYSMEFVDGETLAQLLTKLKNVAHEADTPFGKLDCAGYFEQLARAFADVADGLQHAHTKGIMHRDIKPSNLILDRDERLRILDFGLARLEGQDSLTISGDVVGTPLYMSPEQARRKKIPVDHRTDVYSLGATLYELLTLQPPFRGKDIEDTLSQIIERDPVEPRRLNPRVPKDLETIVLKCLRKEAGDRYGTAEALGQDLRRFVRGDAIEARRRSSLEIATGRLWRNRGKVLFGAVLLVLVAALGMLTLLHRDRRLARDLKHYEEAVVRAMIQVELAGLPEAVAAQLETKRLLGGGALDVSDFEGTEDGLGRALRFLDEVEAAVPGRPEAPYQRARVLLALNRRREARDALESCLLTTPGFLPARARLLALTGTSTEATELRTARSSGHHGWEAYWTIAQEAMRRGDYSEVVEAATKLLECFAEGNAYLGAEIEARLWRIHARLQLQDARAIGDAFIVESRVPAAPEPALLQGMVLHVLGHREEAEDTFQKAEAAFGHQRNVRVRVAGIYLEVFDFERASRWIESIEQESVRERLRALRLLAIGSHEAAVEAARRAVQLDPRSPQNHLALVQVLDLRDTEEQSAAAERAVQLHPADAHLKIALSKVRFRQRRYEEGAALTRDVLASSSGAASALDTLGGCLFRLGRVDEALAALQEDPRTSHNLGWAYFNLGRLDEALVAYEEALRLWPRESWAMRLLGVISARRGEDDKAQRYLTTALECFPREGFAQHNLGIFLEERGDLQGALESYAESFRLAPRGFSHWRLSSILREAKVSELDLTVLGPLAQELERLVSLPGKVWEKQLLARILLLGRPAAGADADVLQRAFELAATAAEEATSPYPELLATLADTRHALGDAGGAMADLEAAVRLPHATRSMAEQLASWYSKLLPEVPTFGAVEAEHRHDEKSDATFGSPSCGSPARESFRAGLHALREGRHDEALAAFSATVQEAPDAVEPLVHASGAALAGGRFEEALHHALAGLERFPHESRFAGHLALLWSALAARVEDDLARAAAGNENGSARAVLDVLQDLRDGGGLRINCGGKEHRDELGRRWQQDGFGNGGWIEAALRSEALTVNDAYDEASWWEAIEAYQFNDPIAGTSEPRIYRTSRSFHPSALAPCYRIPVPPGSYLVRLHFAETWYRAEGLRRFDVLAEGSMIIEGLDPFSRNGFARAFVEEAICRVDDGLLEIEFRALRGCATVSAIEVLRAE